MKSGPKIPAVFIATIFILISSLVLASPDAPLHESEANLFSFEERDFPELPANTKDLIQIGHITLALAFASPENPHVSDDRIRLFSTSGVVEKWTHIDEFESLEFSPQTVPANGRWIVFPRRTDGEVQPIVVSVESDQVYLSKTLPPLPVNDIQAISGASLGDRIFLALQESDAPLELISYRISRGNQQWQIIDEIPLIQAEALYLIAHHQSLYLFTESAETGTQRAFTYNPLSGWRSLRNPPLPVARGQAVTSGDAHLLFLNIPGIESAVVGYHVTTDSWARMGTLPFTERLVSAHALADVTAKLHTPSRLLLMEAQMQPTAYGWRDNVVLVVFMGMMIGVGVYLARRERTKADYFRGGRQIPFWASGLSLFATGASGISLMAMPGRAFEDNWAYLTLSFFIAATYPLVLLVYVPIARRLNVSTANEYLERRYNLGLRLGGSIIYSLNQIMARLAAIMILPAIAISLIAGIPMETSILVMGLVTTLYATLGGLEGVIWTDVIQAVVMLIAVFLCATWALIALNADPATAFAAIQSAEKLRSFDLTISLLGPTSLVLFANVVATTISMIGDQNFIQRVQCTPTEKDARKAVLTQISVAVPLNVILFSLGTILFLFYRERPEMLNPTIRADGIFPLFAAQNLPAGLAGLVIAALFAATMSTLSSAINSTANLGVEDFYRRLFGDVSPRKCLILGRILSATFGILGTMAALWLLHSDLRSVWDLAMMLTGMILAPIAGIFFLGIFTTRAHSNGVIVGAASAILATYLVKTYTPLHHFLYLPIGVLSCISVGYLASLILPNPGKNLKGLTAYTIYKEASQ